MNDRPGAAQHRVLVTGAAGYVGAMLVDLFSQRTDVSHVIGIDKEPLPEWIAALPMAMSKLTYIVANIADNSWQAEAAALEPDIVIHTAWQIREMYGKKREQWRWNVTGSDKAFDFAFGTPSVKKLIHFSTVASYGSFPTNTVEHRFNESEPFRKSDYLYAEEKRISEEHLKERYEAARRAGSRVQVAIIRPAALTGPRGRYMRVRFGLQATLSGQLKSSKAPIHRLISAMVSFVPITRKWLRQFIHEDDIADITALLAFQPLKTDYEAFNACPPGDVVLGRDMAAAVGKKAVTIPPILIRLVFFVMWHISRGKVPTSKGGWKSYSYPIAVDGSKLTRMYGYQYRWPSKEAFVKREGRYMKYVDTN